MCQQGFAKLAPVALEDFTQSSVKIKSSYFLHYQMNPPLHKPNLPKSQGKKVTVTFSEKPGKVVFRMQNSPEASGVSYTTERTPDGPPTPNNVANEIDEDRARSEEEETKIKVATQAIKNVLKLFEKGNEQSHIRNSLTTQATQDFPADSKSLNTGREMTEIENEIKAQEKSEDSAAATAQALSKQIGQELSPKETEPGVPNAPNYAVISMGNSKDWKNLAHVLAAQLKRVLNHMGEREKENQYEQEKIQEQMMLMAGDEDDEPDNDDDDDDDYGMRGREIRRHSVLSPYGRNRSENAAKNYSLTGWQSRRVISRISRKKVNEHKLLHRVVHKLSRLEMLHKSHGQKQSISNR